MLIIHFKRYKIFIVLHIIQIAGYYYIVVIKLIS